MRVDKLLRHNHIFSIVTLTELHALFYKFGARMWAPLFHGTERNKSKHYFTERDGTDGIEILSTRAKYRLAQGLDIDVIQ